MVTEPWEPDAQAATPVVQSANEEHTQELDATVIMALILTHAEQLMVSEGLFTHQDLVGRTPGYGCFWQLGSDHAVFAFPSYNRSITYNYMGKEDIWLVTSAEYGCKDNLETWTIDDNTGAITYGGSTDGEVTP